MTSITISGSHDQTSPEAPSVSASKVLDVTGGKAQLVHAWLILLGPTCAAVIAGIQVFMGKTPLWAVLLAAAGFVLTFIGTTVGFHRLLTHRSFKTGVAVRTILAILGSVSTQGPLIYWVGNHRRHHHFCDSLGDPHSPHNDHEESLHGWRGVLHAHIGWTFTHRLTNSAAFCKDLLQDRQLRWINKAYYFWVFLGLLIPTLIGWGIERTVEGALTGLLWGGGVRLFLSYHITNSINSVTHLYGYRTFPTREQSRNNVWLALPTMGEAWHNNHHAYPRAAIFGFEWWQLDLGGLVVRALQSVGLAWDVVRADPSSLAKLHHASSADHRTAEQ